MLLGVAYSPNALTAWWPREGSNSSWTFGIGKRKLHSPFSYLHDSAMQEFSMPSYDSFMCPNCEQHFRVIWPEPVPTHPVCSSGPRCRTVPDGYRCGH